MKTKITRIEIYKADIPFRVKFRHSIRERSLSESVFAKVSLSGGTAGFGEGLPRTYVTGEDQDGVVGTLNSFLPGHFLGREFTDFNGVVTFLRSLDGIDGAARCAAELALLDAAGKAFGRPVSLPPAGRDASGSRTTGQEALRGTDPAPLVYSGVVSGGSLTGAALSALKMRLYGMAHVKVKAGTGNDPARIRILRGILGRGVDIRIDANGAWGEEEAISAIKRLDRYSISAVEQPVKKGDINGMGRVTGAVRPSIMADESLCTKDDAIRLISGAACDMFNIRISKCGGLLRSLEIADMARKARLTCQLGCQVGESGILSAAGRHFVRCLGNVRYLEGSYAGRLLVEDIVKERVGFGRGGRAEYLEGPGLGVTVDEGLLGKYVSDKVTIE